MKAILLSIKPKWVEKILNGEKTIEVRKKFPKDFRGWVYIYCTKNKKDGYEYAYKLKPINGKVVARFWCDNVEKLYNAGDFYNDQWGFNDFSITPEDVVESSCLTLKEIIGYLNYKDGYAIHISQLEIFDRPKELGKFRYEQPFKGIKAYLPKIVKAPQNYCYIEVEE